VYPYQIVSVTVGTGAAPGAVTISW
jgi:hypothetical protein